MLRHAECFRTPAVSPSRILVPKELALLQAKGASDAPEKLPAANADGVLELEFTPLKTLLVTGDSLAMPLDAELARRLAGKVDVKREPHIGTGITKTDLLDWGAESTRQVHDLHPQAVVTEHFMRFAVPEAGEWLTVRTVIDDPTYLVQPFMTSTNFKREADGSKWNPKACRE